MKRDDMKVLPLGLFILDEPLLLRNIEESTSAG